MYCLSCGNTLFRLTTISILSLLSALGWTVCAYCEPSPFATLQERLVRDGFDKSTIRALYLRPEATFDEKSITAYFLHRESTLNYGQFLTRSSIGDASNYLRKHGRAFQRARELYGVEGEIVTAILLVESRLGTYKSKRLVFKTLSNLAVVDDTANRDMLWYDYVKDRGRGTKDEFDKWARRKSAWAYRELKAYLKYVKAQNLDPLSLRGSYAGALGFAQFVPSSVLKFGIDGNKDGQINLSQHRDAIESVANYLKGHGWKPQQSRDEAFRVLLSYNHSKYYADTILEVAERLSGNRRK
ncbi:MAG: lytic murein transglycosylase [Deltaproteobacteria bacterium]|nr:lytic murein transglycosylase [Deltaproteobacteria bacterium]